jgi:hypothetical protein
MGGRRTCRGPYSPLSRQPAKWVSYSELTDYAGTKSSGVFLYWLGWDLRFGATECRSSSFFSRPLLCHAASSFNTYSLFVLFLFYQLPASHVEIPRAGAGSNDGRARAASFDLILCLRSAPPCRPLAIFRHCQYLRQPRFHIPRFSAVLYSHAEHPVSEYVVSCEKRFSVSSRVFRLF